MTSRVLSVASFVLLGIVLSVAAQVPSAESPQRDTSAKTNSRNQEAAPEAEAGFDERAAGKVLGTIRDGLESRSQRRLLSVFDDGKMDGFLTFEDQIEAFFSRYESCRVTVRIIQTSEENNRGVILAELQLETESRDGTFSRRQGQLRFELERSATGWKIVDFNPRDFFS